MTTQGQVSLASDNTSGMHPAVLRRITQANAGHAPAYGADDLSAAAEKAFEQQFGPGAAAFLVCTGTAANVVGLQALAQSVDAVLCSDEAHLLIDEGGAPECMIGCKLVPLPSQDAKISVDALAAAIKFQSSREHRNRARVLSLSQVTERGTLYTPDEMRALTDCAHAHGLRVHLDGARLANAAAALGLSLRACTRELGVDVVSFGGTKNGLMMAEAVVVFDPDLAAALPAIRKQGMQLVSKQRFLAAQFLAYFEEDLWLQNARHANRMAARLAQHLQAFDAVRLMAPVQANIIFARVPRHWIPALQRQASFYVWDVDAGEIRLVTSFDTRETEIDAFAAEMQRLAAAGAASM